MINIQNYVNPNRTGRAGLRIAHIKHDSSSLSLSPAHSAPRFSQSDVGKNIVVIGVGVEGANLHTTISVFIDSTHVELAAKASTDTPKVGAAIAWWDNSQDDTAAFNHAQDSCAVGNGILYCPGDVYIITSTLVASQNLQSIIGDGARQTFFVCTSSLTGNFLSVPNVQSWFSLGGAPAQGFTVLGPGFQTPATVTAWSVTANVATFTAHNSFKAGEQILLQGFRFVDPNHDILNDKLFTVLASGLSNTQFKANLTATDTSMIDNGVATLNWNGIAFTSDGAHSIGIGNIEIQAFPGDGVQINDTIVSDFRKVIVSHCGQGFNDMPSSRGAGGTSLNFDTCFANGNYKAGYYVSGGLAYSSLNNCAADNNGVGYYLHRAQSISFNGSGSEEQLYRNAAYPGYAYYFHGATNCALNCPYATSGGGSDPRSTHLVFDNHAKGIFVTSFKANVQEQATPPRSVFTIDNTCSDITIWEPEFSISGTKAWTDNGSNDTIYFNGQFQTGVKGASQAGPGVYGVSIESDGMRGISHSNAHPGVYGESDAYEGVRGVSHSAHGAIVGINDGQVITVEGAGPGVYGTSKSSDGVKGSVFSGYVQGPAVAAGVWGENTGSGPGVKGTSQGGDGVLGFSSAGSHAGVSANNLGGGMGLYASGNPAGHFQGNVEVTGDLCLVNQDCAEDFEISDAEEIEPGTVMVIDRGGALHISECAYDRRVAGVISGAGDLKPGIILGRQQSPRNMMPIALLGKVNCKVDAGQASIEVGDLLTTSPTRGHAMKAVDPSKAFGAVIGKALLPLGGGVGVIPILIALQ
jgi:hypothetical protein